MLPSDFGFNPSRFPNFRVASDVSQLDIAAEIVLNPRRHFLLNSPPGSGKTIIDSTAHKLAGLRTLVLVRTKNLQGQRNADFADAGLFDIRGHRNYPCALSYDDGELECQASRQGTCQYRERVLLAQSQQWVQTNYSHWIHMALCDDPARLGSFGFLILDEAHQAHDQLTDAMSVTIRLSDLARLDIIPPLPGAKAGDPSTKILVEWANAARDTVRIQYQALKDQGPGRDEKTLLRLLRLGQGLKRIVESATDHGVEWKLEVSEDSGHPRSRYPTFTLSPLWGKEFAEKFLFRNIPKVLLVSGTLSPRDAQYLGIRPSEMTYREVDNAFDPNRRPVIYCPTSPPVRVDSRITRGEERIWVNRHDSIIESSLPYNHKGIIQPRSYKRAETIAELSRFSDYMITHGPGQAEEAIARFKATPLGPLFLNSPATQEGVDFPGIRLLFMSKVPFPDTRSVVMKARVKSDPTYRNFLTARDFLQAALRGSRSASDWCRIIVIDAHWPWFAKEAKDFFPRYFRASFRTCEGRLPEPELEDGVRVGERIEEQLEEEEEN